MRKDKVRQILIDMAYTRDAKPRFINDKWVNLTDDRNLVHIEEAVERLVKVFDPTPYESAGELLSVDEQDGLSLQEMLDKIIAQDKIDGTVIVDTLDGVFMWEKLEWSFSCRNFLEHIGLK